MDTIKVAASAQTRCCLACLRPPQATAAAAAAAAVLLRRMAVLPPLDAVSRPLRPPWPAVSPRSRQRPTDPPPGAPKVKGNRRISYFNRFTRTREKTTEKRDKLHMF